MKIDCSRLFPESHLHLLVWDRFDSVAHREGLDFMVRCLTDARLSGHVMPLLRPRGREEQNYARFDVEFLGGSAGSLPTYGGVPGLSCCELWLQVTEGLEADLWNDMKDWASNHQPAKVWRSHGQALWQPLAPCFSECEYAETAKAPCHLRGPDALAVLSNLPLVETAWLLKVIWYRAAVAIRDEMLAGTLKLDLDPRDRSHRQLIAAILGKMLVPLLPSDYGIPWQHIVNDPCAFVVSHMTAFAINALTKVDQGTYSLEDYRGDCRLTRPYLFPQGRDYFTFVAS